MLSYRFRSWNKRWRLALARRWASVVAAVKSPRFWAVSAAVLAIGAAVMGINYLAIDFRSGRSLESVCRSSGNARLLVIMAGGAVAMLSSVFAIGEAMDYHERRRQKVAGTRLTRPVVAVGLALAASGGYVALLKLLC